MNESERGSAVLAEAWAAIDAGDIPRALKCVSRAYERIGRWCQGGQRLPIGWPEADRLIAAVADIVRPSADAVPAPAKDGGNDAVVLSHWSEYGGHRFVASDVLRASPARRKHAFVFDFRGLAPSAEEIATRLGIPDDCVEVSPREVLETPWEWFPARAAALGCSRLFVFHETFHPGALVAVLASRLARAYVVHHTDGKPCSGLHLPGVRVVEVTPFCHHYSRRNLGIDPLYLPLVSDPPTGDRPPFMAGGQLRTATCGREMKFAVRRGFPYAAVIAERLRRFGGSHLHIGGLSERARALIDGALRDADVAKERFEHLTHVESLPIALWANQIDLYIGSFPAGGARTTVDVMASATPAVSHSRAGREHYSNTSLRAPGTEHWSTPEELWSILGSANSAWLTERSRLARAHFDRHHRRELLAEALARPDFVGLEPPPIPADARIPSPQDVLCQIIADVTWLRHREKELSKRLAALEGVITPPRKWPHFPWLHWFKR